MLSTSGFSAGECGVTAISPQTALVISEVDSAGMAARDVSQIVMEHTIHTKNGKSALGAGSMIGPQRLGDIVSMLDETAARQRRTMYLPANVIATGPDFAAWHVPSKVRPMLFNCGGEAFSLRVPWPALLFVAGPRGLVLAGLDTNERPDPETPLYHAPLMNHSTVDGGLCFGSVRKPPHVGIDTIPAYEQAVFESYFSHVNGPNHLRYRKLKRAGDTLTSDAHIAFYRSLEARRLRQFPTRHLLPLNATVGDLINKQG